MTTDAPSRHDLRAASTQTGDVAARAPRVRPRRTPRDPSRMAADLDLLADRRLAVHELQAASLRERPRSLLCSASMASRRNKWHVPEHVDGEPVASGKTACGRRVDSVANVLTVPDAKDYVASYDRLPDGRKVCLSCNKALYGHWFELPSLRDAGNDARKAALRAIRADPDFHGAVLVAVFDCDSGFIHTRSAYNHEARDWGDVTAEFVDAFKRHIALIEKEGQNAAGLCRFDCVGLKPMLFPFHHPAD